MLRPPAGGSELLGNPFNLRGHEDSNLESWPGTLAQLARAARPTRNLAASRRDFRLRGALGSAGQRCGSRRRARALARIAARALALANPEADILDDACAET